MLRWLLLFTNRLMMMYWEVKSFDFKIRPYKMFLFHLFENMKLSYGEGGGSHKYTEVSRFIWLVPKEPLVKFGDKKVVCHWEDEKKKITIRTWRNESNLFELSWHFFHTICIKSSSLSPTFMLSATSSPHLYFIIKN